MSEYVLGGGRRMENVKKGVEKSQERMLEFKVVELEQSAYRLLALTKELHGNFFGIQGRGRGEGNYNCVSKSDSR